MWSNEQELRQHGPHLLSPSLRTISHLSETYCPPHPNPNLAKTLIHPSALRLEVPSSGKSSLSLKFGTDVLLHVFIPPSMSHLPRYLSECYHYPFICLAREPAGAWKQSLLWAMVRVVSPLISDKPGFESRLSHLDTWLYFSKPQLFPNAHHAELREDQMRPCVWIKRYIHRTAQRNIWRVGKAQ